MKKILLLIIFLSFDLLSKEKGQTEITAEEGIEVFQKEKYYLLKKNVIIDSDNFDLTADIVKVYFKKDLYDIIKIESEGNAKLNSKNGILIKGKKLNYYVKNKNIEVFGIGSFIENNNIKMLSDESIEINNVTGNFALYGPRSRLKTNEVDIMAKKIEGKYINVNGNNEIENLTAEDESIANFKTSEIDMFAIKAIYNKATNLIELFESVKVIKDNEIILGDYAMINTLNQSYKVTSKKTNKVKILISDSDE